MSFIRRLIERFYKRPAPTSTENDVETPTKRQRVDDPDVVGSVDDHAENGHDLSSDSSQDKTDLDSPPISDKEENTFTEIRNKSPEKGNRFESIKTSESESVQNGASATPHTDTEPITESDAEKDDNNEVVFPSDLSKTKDDPPSRPILESYPKSVTSPRKKVAHAFQEDWFEDYPWLEYSEKADAAYCFACRHFAVSSAEEKDPSNFSKFGFSNWHLARSSKVGLKAHDKSQAHVKAINNWRNYKDENDGIDTIAEINE